MPYQNGWYVGPWMWVMMVFMALFWVGIIGGVIWLIVYLARRSGRGPGTGSTENALDILNQRYARGEISKEEYDRIKKEITER